MKEPTQSPRNTPGVRVTRSVRPIKPALKAELFVFVGQSNEAGGHVVLSREMVRDARGYFFVGETGTRGTASRIYQFDERLRWLRVSRGREERATRDAAYGYPSLFDLLKRQRGRKRCRSLGTRSKSVDSLAFTGATK
jgi:hypothetical protein